MLTTGVTSTGEEPLIVTLPADLSVGGPIFAYGHQDESAPATQQQSPTFVSGPTDIAYNSYIFIHL